MNLIKLNFSQNKKRYIFSLLSLVVAGATLIFSLFFTSSIKESISRDLPLKKGEIHLSIDETRFDLISINYYEGLKENFDFVVPFVNDSRLIKEQSYQVYGSDMDYHIFYQDPMFIEYSISKTFENKTNYPKLRIHESQLTIATDNIIVIDAVEYEVVELFKFQDEVLQL